MWGYAMEHILGAEAYRDTEKLKSDYAHMVVNDWIYPHPIWALITRGILTKRQIFDCLTSDVDTVNRLINKLCSGKSTEVANAIRVAFAHNDVPVITGNNPSGLNVNATYSIPTANNLANAFSFNGWTVSPSSGHSTTSGLNNRNLTIKFTAYGTYTLTANFRLPDGSNYSPTKTVTMAPPPPPAPIISADKSSVRQGDYVTFTVNSPQTGTTYQWEINGTIEPNWTAHYITTNRNGSLLDPFSIQPYVINGFISARCRTVSGTIFSPWSNNVSVMITSSSSISR